MTDHRVQLTRTPEEQAEEDEFLAPYGEWAPMSRAEFAAEMQGFDRPWWVVGGWAIEAATGFRREHEDLDVSMLTCDEPRSQLWLRGCAKDPWIVDMPLTTSVTCCRRSCLPTRRNCADRRASPTSRPHCRCSRSLVVLGCATPYGTSIRSIPGSNASDQVNACA